MRKNRLNMKRLASSFVLAFMCVFASFAQNVVRGTVNDATGKLMIGVSVVVKGTNNRQITDINGKYSITTTSDDILVFESVGMISQEVKVGSRATINITMKEDVVTLNESKLVPNQYEIYGSVTCEGKGVPDVMVTDGVRCVTTDENGIYRMPYLGDARFVYITTPAGYLTDCDRSIPLFYHEIDSAQNNREYNFRLKKNSKDDSRHVMILEADVQAATNEHWEKYENVIPDYNKLLTSYADRDAFAVTCGDIGWDTPKTFFEDYIPRAERIGVPVYRVIGNHDMDYNGRAHETSYRTFEGYFGPSCYSFNKGNAHYIVIDNNFYIGREYFYMGYVDEKTFNWLEQDLSYVPKGTVVFLAAHIPMRITENIRPFEYSYMVMGGETINAESLFKLFEGYETHFLTGHLHTNANVIYNDRQMEHNIGAVCGTWWHTATCLDGTPQGYQVFEVDGNKVKWYYKCFGYPINHQFRAYAPGTVKQYPKDIVVNVWNYDKNWKVEWLENGAVMGEMKPYRGIDPFAEKMVADHKKTMQSWIAPQPTGHLFRAIPRHPKAKIEVRVTDRFGNVYQEAITHKWSQ